MGPKKLWLNTNSKWQKMSVIEVVEHSKILNKKYFQNLDFFFFMVKIDLEKSNLDNLK